MWRENFVVLVLFIVSFVAIISGCRENFAESAININAKLTANEKYRDKPIATPTPVGPSLLRSEMNGYIEQSDLEGLVKLMDDVQALKGSEYISLLADICSAFNSYDFKSERQYLLTRNCSKKVLTNKSEVSISLEQSMIENLQGVEEYKAGLVAESEWRKDRAERVSYLRHLSESLNKDYDPNFDFKDPKNIPVGNVCVPAPNYMCGIRPEDVKEPEIREKYVAAIDANAERAKAYNKQMLIHRIMKTFPAFVDQFLVGMYSQPPLDISELAGVLNSFGITGARKENILANVKQYFQ